MDILHRERLRNQECQPLDSHQNGRKCSYLGQVRSNLSTSDCMFPARWSPTSTVQYRQSVFFLRICRVHVRDQDVPGSLPHRRHPRYHIAHFREYVIRLEKCNHQHSCYSYNRSLNLYFCNYGPFHIECPYSALQRHRRQGTQKKNSLYAFNITDDIPDPRS